MISQHVDRTLQEGETMRVRDGLGVRSWDPVTRVGGEFMRSSLMSEAEQRLGIPERTLYVKGRVAPLGDVPPAVAGDVYAIFPSYYVTFACRRADALSRVEALDAYVNVCAAWGESFLADVPGPVCERLTSALRAVVHAADSSAMPLFGAWRRAALSFENPYGSLAYELMRVRELRGGLHFSALRSVGLPISAALMADRQDGGHARLLRSGWSRRDADRLAAASAADPTVQERWDLAEQRTEELFEQELRVALGEDALRVVDELESLAEHCPHAAEAGAPA